MKDFLANYSASEILLFLVFFAIALKEGITLVDWLKERLRKVYDKDYKAKEERKEIEREIDDLNKIFDERKKVDDGFEKINSAISKINEQIEMLIVSDKESIKAFITEKHHYFVYEKGWIDDYSMDCIEKRFAVYQQEHGNSFVEDLMNEMRGLPKRPPQ